MHTLIAAASALISAATVSGGLQLPADGPATFYVAGVRLNMTPEEAKAALVHAGYRNLTSSTADSFAQRVDKGVKARLQGGFVDKTVPASIGGMIARGPNGETLGLSFAATPAGARVIGINLDVPDDRQASQAFMAQAQQHFGKATAKTSPVDWRWCGAGDKECGVMAVPNLPTLTVSYTAPHNLLRLDAGPAAAAALDAQLKAKIDQRLSGNRAQRLLTRIVSHPTVRT